MTGICPGVTALPRTHNTKDSSTANPNWPPARGAAGNRGARNKLITGFRSLDSSGFYSPCIILSRELSSHMPLRVFVLCASCGYYQPRIVSVHVAGVLGLVVIFIIGTLRVTTAPIVT